MPVFFVQKYVLQHVFATFFRISFAVSIVCSTFAPDFERHTFRRETICAPQGCDTKGIAAEKTPSRRLNRHKERGAVSKSAALLSFKNFHKCKFYILVIM